MRILFGVAERGTPGLLDELSGILPLRGHEIVLAHVIDTGARGELERTRSRLRPPRPLPPHRIRAIGEAERRAAGAALGEAEPSARGLGARAETVLAEGEPGRVLVTIAEERDCALVVVGARVDRRHEPPGPRSVGHTARFVLDHSRRPVLLLPGRLPG